jgi:hypothetical protein
MLKETPRFYSLNVRKDSITHGCVCFPMNPNAGLGRVTAATRHTAPAPLASVEASRGAIQTPGLPDWH